MEVGQNLLAWAEPRTWLPEPQPQPPAGAGPAPSLLLSSICPNGCHQRSHSPQPVPAPKHLPTGSTRTLPASPQRSLRGPGTRQRRKAGKRRRQSRSFPEKPSPSPPAGEGRAAGRQRVAAGKAAEGSETAERLSFPRTTAAPSLLGAAGSGRSPQPILPPPPAALAQPGGSRRRRRRPVLGPGRRLQVPGSGKGGSPAGGCRAGGRPWGWGGGGGTTVLGGGEPRKAGEEG